MPNMIKIAPTRYLDDIAKAASQLGYEGSLVRYQILAYAERNDFCHFGIKDLAEHGHLNSLGENFLEDLRSLDIIFRDRPHEQIEMRKTIKIVEKEWFQRLFFEENGRKQRELVFVLTEKGNAEFLSKPHSSS